MSLKYAYLGPAGTFTQAALQKIADSSDELIPYANVTAALNAVRSGECAKALVPIENSVEGVVARTLDELLDLSISNKKDLVIELKHPVPTGALIEKLVHKLLLSRNTEIINSGIKISLISFSYLATLRNLKSGYQAGYLVKNSNLIKINPAPVIALNINIVRQNPKVIADQHKKGKKVFVWTVNEASDLLLCAKEGVDAVITDKPAQARMLLGYS